MVAQPAGAYLRWRRSIVLSVKDGKLMHSGLKRPVRIRKTPGGVFIGCTYVTHEALRMIAQQQFVPHNRRKKDEG